MAATNIAKLSVLFTSDASQFDKGVKKSLGKARKQFAEFSKLVATGTGAVAGALTGIVKSASAAADSLAKTSAKLGMTTTELAGLRYAAELSGVGIAQLDTGLQRIIRRTSEAANGMGEARGALVELGIDAARFDSLSQSEKIYALADAFSDVESAGDKVRLMMKLADTEGVGLVNTLALGADRIKAMQIEAKRLGLAFEDGAAGKFEKFNDQIKVASKQFTGLKNTIATEVLPILSKFNGMMGELTLAERYKIFNRTVEVVFNNIVASVQDAASSFTHFRADLVDGVKSFVDSNKNIIDAFIGIVEKVVNSALRGLSKLLLKATMGLNSLIIKANEIAGTSVEGFTFAGFGQVSLPKADDISGALGEKSAELRDQAAQYAKMADFSRKMAEGAQRDIDRIKQTARDAGEITGDSVENIIEGIDSVVESAIDAAERMRRPWENALDGMMGGLHDLITTGRTQWKNFGDFILDTTSRVVADYVTAWAEAMAKQMAMAAVTAGTKSNVGWVSTLAGLFVGGVGGGGGSLTGLASGGPASGGVPYLVGEHESEIMMPNTSGQVIPNHRIGDGGTVVNITNAHSGAKIDVDDSDPQRVEVIIKRVKKEVANDIRDGRGDIPKALGAAGVRRGAA